MTLERNPSHSFAFPLEQQSKRARILDNSSVAEHASHSSHAPAAQTGGGATE